MNTIDFIVFLYLKKRITYKEGISLIESLKFRVKEKYIAQAINYIKEKRKKGE
jgi:hypothetical protein